jgi:hypothetical protein
MKRIGSGLGSNVGGASIKLRSSQPRTTLGTLVISYHLVGAEERTLLNSTKLFGKVLIGGSSSHLFKSLFPVGKVLEPLVDLLGCLSATVLALLGTKAYSPGSWT